MPRVYFTSNLQRHLACPTEEVPGATVEQALGAVFERNPRLRSYLLDDQGRLRKHVALYLNNQAIRDREGLSDPVAGSDELFVFQALSGG